MGGLWATISAPIVDVLLRDSAYGAIVFLLVVVISGALHNRRPALRLALWSLVFVRLVLPPDLSHPLAVGELLPGFASLLGHDDASERGAGGGVMAALQPLGDTDHVGAPERIVPGWVTWLLAAWCMGAAAAAAGHARRLRRVRHLLARSETCHDAGVLELVRSWRSRLRIRRSVRVVVAESEVVPFTVGILRPVVCVPRAALGDRRFLEPALAHELAHVACWHALWLAAQHAVQIVYWFHPAAWFAGVRIAHERELLCDALVLQHRALPAPQYARSLLLASRMRAPDGPAFALTASSRRFSMRIRNVLESARRRPPRRLAAAAVAAGLALVVLPMSGGASGSSSGDPQNREQRESAVEMGNPLPEGRVTWRWGEGRDPWSGEPVFHRGVDLGAPAGTPIVAPAAGFVAVATTEYEPSPTSGTVAMLDHGGGVTTFYAHLGKLVVDEGDHVDVGQVIAEVGSTGKSTAPHLHFEIRRDGEPQDPAKFVEDWQ